ncbi:hypothetical protein ACFWF7_19770 [Nocardia sp. NPDC060256]|uniref:hypothetical protein n=1 Tax=unclassified Nocardia TaxID=2637762 RepID=UPI00364763CB
MKRTVANSLLLGALGLGSLLGAAQATAESGLLLETAPSAQSVDDPVTGSATTFSKTLSSLSGGLGGATPAARQ